ncbi:Translation initiation factor RLI1 (ATP-binding cassette sub-family E member RLI1) [Durusdinium trenchii]|uniref:Translation initiation factor RLI1 (ATP-binding cassette sub-family E member RLI1) n=1 Tax=Durusdinium trenchii TaxID=1381693 RepID=A0ABP0JP78_9DINO
MGKKAKESGGGEDDEKKLRIAIVNSDRCKPKKCKAECKTHCPVVRTGKLCVEAEWLWYLREEVPLRGDHPAFQRERAADVRRRKKPALEGLDETRMSTGKS